jgi:hypothetical protein
MSRNDTYYSFGTFNNKGNDIVAGWTTSGCIILVRLYSSKNYGGSFDDFYGDTNGGTSAQYYYFNSAQRNNFESGTSSCS